MDFPAQPFVDGTSCEVVESKPLVGSSAKSNKGCATNSIPLATRVSLQEFMVIFSESPCYIQNVQSYTCWWTHNILKVQKRRRQHIQELVRYLKNDSGIGFMKCCLWLLKACTFKGYVTKLLDSCQPFVNWATDDGNSLPWVDSTPMVDVEEYDLSLPPFIKGVPDTKNTGFQGKIILKNDDKTSLYV